MIFAIIDYGLNGNESDYHNRFGNAFCIVKESIDKDNKRKKERAERPDEKSYGEYGWVKLTDTEHDKLVKDLGEDTAKACIQRVDELAQQTSNKNKWKDWNLVVRRCAREKWYVPKGWQNSPQQSKRDLTYNSTEEHKGTYDTKLSDAELESLWEKYGSDFND